MSRGLDRERRIARALEDEGWLVASRRHIGGAGDLLAIRDESQPLGGTEMRLIEVKSTVSPYAHFLPLDRKAMREAAAKVPELTAWLYWWPKGRGEWVEICSRVWP